MVSCCGLSVRTAISVVVAVAARPGLWPTAFRQLRLLARPRWWAKAPWLPVPDAGYLRFRLLTAYGDPLHQPEPADVLTYLNWCKAWPRRTSG